jgi:hypothetical protein
MGKYNNFRTPDIETDEHYVTYSKKPKQRKKSNYISESEVDSLVKRLFKYEQDRLQKLKYATELKEQEEMLGITFQPQLIAKQIVKESEGNQTLSTLEN